MQWQSWHLLNVRSIRLHHHNTWTLEMYLLFFFLKARNIMTHRRVWHFAPFWMRKENLKNSSCSSRSSVDPFLSRTVAPGITSICRNKKMLCAEFGWWCFAAQFPFKTSRMPISLLSLGNHEWSIQGTQVVGSSERGNMDFFLKN